jgi:hypothetical protein
MNLFQLANARGFGIQVLAVTFGLILAGCSSSSSNTGAPAPASQSAQGAGSTKTTQMAAAEAPAPKSTFTIDQNSRDPFFPKAKRAVAAGETTTKQPEAAIDLVAVLQAAFQGVIGNRETRIALINNIMLEPGRQTVIPISAGGQSRNVAVKCREVLKDAVVLEVQGYPQPVRLVRAAHN